MIGLFKTLWRPDREEDPEKTLVARAANVLQIGEFQLLQLAYFEWYSEEMPEELSSFVFQSYMVRGEVPGWARHYARRVLDADITGDINPNHPDFHRYDNDYVTYVPKGVRQFCLASFILAGVLVSGLLVGVLTGADATSVLPPYFEKNQLQQTQDTNQD